MKRIILEESKAQSLYIWSMDISHDNSVLFVAARQPNVYVVDVALKKITGTSLELPVLRIWNIIKSVSYVIICVSPYYIY